MRSENTSPTRKCALYKATEAITDYVATNDNSFECSDEMCSQRSTVSGAWVSLCH